MFAFAVFFAFCSFTAQVSGITADSQAWDPSDNSTFRLDYEFCPQANGWLKLHRIPMKWLDARRACALEGARLASPNNEGLSTVMKSWIREEQLPTIHTGFHAIDYVENYISFEGVLLREIRVSWAPGQPDNVNDTERCLTMSPEGQLADVECYTKITRPYFCFKQKDRYTSMNECGYNDKEYQVDPATGRCYKFHKKPRSWSNALTVCNAEGGNLAVINNEAEAKFLADLVAKHNHKTYVNMGFYVWWYDDFWATVDGKTLKEAGYERWRKGNPDNYEGSEYQGSMILGEDGLPELDDINGNLQWPFICEIPAHKSYSSNCYK